MAKKKATKKKVAKAKISKKRMVELLKKHKRLKVVIHHRDGTISRERILTAKGSAVVRYASTHEWDPAGRRQVRRKQIKWSRYSTCCFRYDIDNSVERLEKLGVKLTMPNTANMIVAAMYEHDSDYIYTAKVFAGRGFAKRLV